MASGRRGAAGVRLFTRNGHDWTERFPLIVEALSTLKATTCLIDGEAVACNETGLAEFEGLRGRRGDVHLCAFDLLELDGRDLRLEHLAERRRLLARLVRKPRSGLVLNAMQLGSHTPIAVSWPLGADSLDLFDEPCLVDALALPLVVVC